MSAVDRHPALRAIDDLSRALKDVRDLPVEFMSTEERREALLQATVAESQLESLRLRLMGQLRHAQLLCAWHHHRAHDDRYLVKTLPSGGVRFHKRT